MKFPKRTDTHQIESASWRLLHKLAPPEWIVREVTERDYGIDCYIEIASANGEITGQLISVQLKGTKKIDWKSGERFRTARSPQIKTTTANYWFNLPVPVFLLVAELSTDKIYFVSVEQELRTQYKRLSNQDTVTFKLVEEMNFSSRTGMLLFGWLSVRQRAHDQFAFHITNLLSHITAFSEFILSNQNRDSFMEVESERHLQFRAIYTSCEMASLYLRCEWKVDSLQKLYERDQEQWKDRFSWLHEGTLGYALREIEQLFLPLVKEAINLVSRDEADYWLNRDYVFYNLCSSGEMEHSLKYLEQSISRG